MEGASRATNQRKYNAFSSLSSLPDTKRVQVRPMQWVSSTIWILVKEGGRGFATLAK